MKGFGTFDTTNTLYGIFYTRQQDPITNIPKYSKPNMEEEFYERTLVMQQGYFNRYTHLYKDPTGKPIYNPIDGKAFKEEDANKPLQQTNQELVNEGTLEKAQPLFQGVPDDKNLDEPVMRTFHRNYEAEQQ